MGLKKTSRVKKRTSTRKGKQVTKFVAGSHKLWFGKYKGTTVNTILMVDPSYINWCKNTLTGIRFSNDVLAKLSKALEELRRRQRTVGYDSYWVDRQWDADMASCFDWGSQ